MRIAVIYSLPTKRALATPFAATDEDTKTSAQKVAAALKKKGVGVYLAPIAENEIEKIREIRADCFFNLIEWTGLDLPLAVRAFELIESSGIPFTGSTSDNYELTCLKEKMKQEFDDKGIASPRWQLFQNGSEAVRPDFNYPILVKLAWEHCSIGLTAKALVRDTQMLKATVSQQLREFRQPVYAEEFLSGREFQVTLLEEKESLTIFPPAEIIYPKKEAVAFLTFSGRWDEKHPDYHSSKIKIAELDPTLEKEIKDLCAKCFKALGFRGYARFDLRMNGAHVYVLEANANPGLDDCRDYSLSLSFRAAGLTFADFIFKIVESALKCSGRQEKLGG